MSDTPHTHCKLCSSRLEPWLSASGAPCSICINPHCSDATEYPRLSLLPGQEGQGVSLAAPAEADQVEDTPTSYQQLEARIRQMRRDHHGYTSRGLDVELARYFYEFPVPGDFLPALLLDLQQCAAACIGAGCEPRSPMQVQ